MKPLFAICFVCTLLLIGCKKEDDLDRLGSLNFERPAAIGGRTLAGYQDGALYAKGQANSIPALIYTQIQNYGGGQFNVPKLSAAGEQGIGINPKPWESMFQTKSNLGYRIDCKGVESLGPVKETYSSSTLSDLENNSAWVNGQNMCVPFARMKDLNDPAFGLGVSSGNSYPYYHRMAASPGSSTMLSELVAYNPTFLISWLGMEDIYIYALNGGTGDEMPSFIDFREKMDSILAVLSAGGTKGVLANIPDIHDLPYFNLIPYNGATMTETDAEDLTTLYAAGGAGHISFHEGSNAFIMEDPEADQGIRQIREGELVTLTVPLDSMKCHFYGIHAKFFKDRYVLDLEEISEIEYAIKTYNQVIAELAAKYDFALFDANSFYKTVSSGIKWNGVDYSLEFVSGGFIGLDGVFPNQKGNELLANGMIKAINQKYGTAIPNVNCFQCDGTLFPN
ncbi:MAG: hypothetical protein R3277_09820 [Brumimicrobium sp.]|nr:hypothetical protein [Brumimicrobium sp.]